MKVLVTNDDSHSSPLLRFLFDYLSSQVEFTFVLPAHEQSWRGKSITRFDPLHAHESTLFGVSGWVVDGTPADCINLGIYNLLDEVPDLVISGINAGMNTGISFLLSSGTVGACFEANIAGIGAVALSQQFIGEEHRHYVNEYALSSRAERHLSKQTETCLGLVLPDLLSGQQSLSSTTTLNVNFPYHLSDTERVYPAKVGESFYRRLFRRTGDHFVHDLSEVEVDPRETCDARLLSSGRIAVTSLDVRNFFSCSTT